MTETEIRKKNTKRAAVIRSITTLMMGAEGFLLVFFHISNGETNIVSAGLGYLYIAVPFILIILGILQLAEDNKGKAEDLVKSLLPAMLYIALRLASGIVNSISGDPRYWTTLCMETLFLAGINISVVNRKTVRIVLCELIAFDLIAVSICSYHFLFIKDSMASALSGYPTLIQDNLPFALIFINPNLAGMLGGVCASVCILVFRDASKALRALLAPAIIVNVAFMIWSDCRSAMVGTAVILTLSIVRWLTKGINWKVIIAATLAICIGFMIPVYVVTLTSDHETQLQNSGAEIMLNDLSSGRYNIWKEHILSQKGHYVLGFGTANKAVKARSKYIKDISDDESIVIDETHQSMGERTDLGTHNGYLELILVAGLPAALMVFFLMFSKILSMDNSFIEKHPVILLLVLLFWLCVQESRFITANVRYIAFLMMMLLNWRIDEEAT